nr:FecR domain-containing protein [uncultured Carboxylicivirga sp.]
MKTKIDKSILEKFTRNELVYKEAQVVKDSLANGENDNELKKLVQANFEKFISNNIEKPEDVSHILDRIHHKINSSRFQKENQFKSRFLKWYSKAAAILLIPLLMAAGAKLYVDYKQAIKTQIQQPLTAKVIAPLGSRVSFTLPDGTNGFLNSGSTIEYQVPFAYNRKVNIEGEAWFNVKHDPSHPFEVSSGHSKIKVLGTQFNCNADLENHYMEVILEEGKVEFSTSGLKKNIIMKPNERLLLSDNVLNVNEVDASKYTAWKEGKLVFKSDPMQEVVSRMEKWYNIDIEIVDKELQEYVFRGTFQDDTFEEVFKYLSITSPIKYKIIDRQLQNDGTITPTKVMLFKK